MPAYADFNTMSAYADMWRLSAYADILSAAFARRTGAGPACRAGWTAGVEPGSVRDCLAFHGRGEGAGPEAEEPLRGRDRHRPDGGVVEGLAVGGLNAKAVNQAEDLQRGLARVLDLEFADRDAVGDDRREAVKVGVHLPSDLRLQRWPASAGLPRVQPEQADQVPAASAVRGGALWGVAAAGLTIIASSPVSWGTGADYARYLPAGVSPRG
jgi:hypothetical protein